MAMATRVPCNTPPRTQRARVKQLCSATRYKALQSLAAENLGSFLLGVGVTLVLVYAAR
jgi:hypothetical protein